MKRVTRGAGMSAVVAVSVIAVIAVIAVAAVGCSSLEMTTDWSQQTDFSKYRTFSFKEGSKPRNPVARRSVEYAIQGALEKHGLKMLDDGGDLSIYGHFVQSADVRFETWGYGTAGWYGPTWGGPVVTTAYAIPVGTLFIDLVDSKEKGLVWRGVVKDDISTSLYPEEREKKAIKIADDLFKDFPPKPKAKKG
jgi:hypothetical protein